MNERRPGLFWIEHDPARRGERKDFVRYVAQLEQLARAGQKPVAIATTIPLFFRSRADWLRLERARALGADLVVSREDLNTNDPEQAERFERAAAFVLLAYDGATGPFLDPPPTTRAELIERLIDALDFQVELWGAPAAAREASLADVRARLLSLAARWDDEEQLAPLLAPFLELAAQHQPKKLPERVRALALAGVRNSNLEDLHLLPDPRDERGDRYVIEQEDWQLLTMAAAHLLAGLDELPAGEPPADDPFAGLGSDYPLAWAAFAALARCPLGGVVELELPEHEPRPLPEIGGEFELGRNERTEVIHAMDERFSARLVGALETSLAEGEPLLLPSLKHVSRNPRKLFAFVEALLGNGCTVMTQAVLLAPQLVGRRRSSAGYNEQGLRPWSLESKDAARKQQGRKKRKRR